MQKGKLDDLNSILSSQHMYKPDMFHDEPWVEFIELDVDEPSDKADSSDTQHLLGGSGGGDGGRRGCLGSSHVLNLKDDDSGRASCYDPELPMEALLTAALLPSSEQAKPGGEGGLGGGDDDPALVASHPANSPNNTTTTTTTASPGGPPTTGIAAPDHPGQPQVHPQVSSSSCGPNWASMDFYAQVSDVTPAGGVVLSPGSLLSQTAVPDKSKYSGKVEEKNQEDKKRKEESPKFHLLVVNPDAGYASESIAKDAGGDPQQVMPGAYQTSPPLPPPQSLEDELPREPATCPASPNMPGDYQSPYLLPDTNPAMPPIAPVSDYTVVQDVDAQHSLLLNTSTPQSPPNSAKHLPAMPVMPMGYLSPDLLGNLMP